MLKHFQERKADTGSDVFHCLSPKRNPSFVDSRKAALWGKENGGRGGGRYRLEGRGVCGRRAVDWGARIQGGGVQREVVEMVFDLKFGTIRAKLEECPLVQYLSDITNMPPILKLNFDFFRDLQFRGQAWVPQAKAVACAS